MTTPAEAVELKSGRAAPGLRLNEHLDEEDGAGIRACLQDGPRRYRLEAARLALCFWMLTTLEQELPLLWKECRLMPPGRLLLWKLVLPPSQKESGLRLHSAARLRSF